MFRKLLTFLVVATSMVMSCNSLSSYPTPTPLPGWNNPVTELFVELASLPEGWSLDPYEDTVDVRTNYVSRTFFDSNPNRSDKVIQDIWRAYTTADAEKEFNKLADALRGHGWLPRFPSTNFGPISQITYESSVADKWGLACGIDVIAECRFLALYRNYVTEVYFTLQYDGYEGLNFTEAERLLVGVDRQFSDQLGLSETTLDNPSYLSLTPTALYVGESGITIEQFLLEADALPQEWEIAFQDLEGVRVTQDGQYIVSRNYYHDKCYKNSPYFARCYLTQFVTWYPNVQSTKDEWQRKFTEINIGEPAQLGVWRIPSDVLFSDAGADQSFVACSEVAGGEECEAILRFDNYLIALIAEMRSLTTLMGHSRYGLTHQEFADLVENIALQARSVLDVAK